MYILYVYTLDVRIYGYEYILDLPEIYSALLNIYVYDLQWISFKCIMIYTKYPESVFPYLLYIQEIFYVDSVSNVMLVYL